MKSGSSPKDSGSFCSFFWNGLAIRPQGVVVPCCAYSNRQQIGQLDESSENLAKAYNSDSFRAMRQAALTGVPVKGCEYCYSREPYGKSKRQIANQESTTTDFSVEGRLEDIEYAEIFVGSVCNLKCSICSPELSSSLAADYIQIKLEPAGFRAAPPPVKADSIRQLRKLRRLKFIGGEPFLNKQHDQILAALSDAQLSQLEIEYATNATTLPSDWVLETLKKAKLVDIFMSIDGYGDLNHYLRYPSKWERILEVAAFYRELALQDRRFHISCSTVVSVLNVHDIENIENWFFEFFKEVIDRRQSKRVCFNLIDDPQALRVRNLPAAAKPSIRLPHLRSDMRALILDELNESGNPAQLTGGLQFIDELDRIRKQSFREYIPTLSAEII